MIQANEIKEKVGVPDAAKLYGIESNQHGFARCPFHNEKTASLKIWRDHFYCFGCGAKGSVIDFTMRLFGINFSQACLKLNDDFQLGLARQKTTWAMRQQITLEKRIEGRKRAYKKNCEAELNRLINRRRLMWARYCRTRSELMAEYITTLDEEIDLLTERLGSI